MYWFFLSSKKCLNQKITDSLSIYHDVNTLIDAIYRARGIEKTIAQL